MKIMIEFDPTIATVKVTRPTSVEGEALTQAATKPVVQDAALDAGAYLGITPGEGPSAVLSSQAISAGVATAMSSTPVAKHRDTFVLLSGNSQSEKGLDAGTPKV